MAKKSDNIFVRAKKYRAEHPRISFQDAIKKVSGTKVAGVKRKKIAAVKSEKKTVRVKRRPRITGAVKVSHRATGDKNVHLLKLGKIITARIDAKEKELAKTRGIEQRRLLIGFINGEHDKLDRVLKSMKK